MCMIGRVSVYFALSISRLIVEHATTKDAVEFVCKAGDNVGATITPQHLILNRNALFSGGLRPHVFCLPVLKREVHRRALLEQVCAGNPKFFMGTDSAPHPKGAKESACGCAGVYSAHAAVEFYATVLEVCLEYDFAWSIPALKDILHNSNEKLVLRRRKGPWISSKDSPRSMVRTSMAWSETLVKLRWCARSGRYPPSTLSVTQSWCPSLPPRRWDGPCSLRRGRSSDCRHVSAIENSPLLICRARIIILNETNNRQLHECSLGRAFRLPHQSRLLFSCACISRLANACSLTARSAIISACTSVSDKQWNASTGISWGALK